MASTKAGVVDEGRAMVTVVSRAGSTTCTTSVCTGVRGADGAMNGRPGEASRKVSAGWNVATLRSKSSGSIRVALAARVGLQQRGE